MAVTKKPRRKVKTSPVSKASATSALPDRAAMERFLTTLGRQRANAATEKAQDLVYDAWEATGSRARMVLAHKALRVSPLCADALNLLAAEAKSIAEARELYATALEAAELALGAEAFQEYAGLFWGFLETRPYMRAKVGLASALQELGEEAAAVRHYREMLELNPNDNQGIRYLLAACYLRHGDEAALKDLLATYPDEVSTYWLYTQALMAFREHGADDTKAVALAKAACAENPHVPEILAGTKPPVSAGSDYITVGGPDEATDYVVECGSAWRETRGAIQWLNRVAAGVGIVR